MAYTIFLDRDGVINMDSADYIKSPEEFKFIPQSPEAIALLHQNGFKIIIITNQSLIGRKMAEQKTLNAIFDKMRAGIKQAGGHITDIFFCPHTPADNCPCRKPAPGLILSAQKKHTLDLANACMVGDSAKDIECGKNAGCSKTLLVRTGNGQTALPALLSGKTPPDHVADDLHSAALWIIENLKN